MGRRVDWFLVEVERLLKGHVEGPKLAESLTEIEAHLADSTQDLTPTCLHGEDPESLAIERFGSPWAFAKATVGQAALRPYWKAAILPMCFCFGTAMLAPIAVVFRTSVWFWVCLGLAGFLVSSVLARRWTPVAIALATAVGALVSIGVGAFFIAPCAPFDCFTLRSEIQSSLAIKSRELQIREIDLLTVNRAVAYFAAERPAAGPSEFRVGNGFRYAGFRPDDVAFEDSADNAMRTTAARYPRLMRLGLFGSVPWKAAKAQWHTDGNHLAAEFKSGAAECRRTIAFLARGSLSTRGEAAATVSVPVAYGATLYAGFLIVLNSIAAAFGRFVVTARLLPRRFA